VEAVVSLKVSMKVCKEPFPDHPSTRSSSAGLVALDFGHPLVAR
jgi:hypothetical protein